MLTRRHALPAAVALLWSGLARADNAPPGAPSASTVLGRRVSAAGGEEVGRLVDMVVDAHGAPVAAVLDVGGFMGVGMRRVAIGWALLRFNWDTDGIHIVADLAADTIAALPEFRPANSTTIILQRP